MCSIFDSGLVQVLYLNLNHLKFHHIGLAVKDFEPGFRYKEFGDSNINFITILALVKFIYFDQRSHYQHQLLCGKFAQKACSKQLQYKDFLFEKKNH